MHVPVLLQEVLFYLNAEKGEKFVDGTAGDGGHIFGIIRANPKARILGIDLDQTSLDNLQKEVVRQGLGQKTRLVQGNYQDIDKLAGSDFSKVDGILLDLGFASGQIDDPTRGFSFQTDGPLDMRFDRSQKLTAAEVVNRYPVDKLGRILSDYGEEKFSRRIASNIILRRKQESIGTTAQLAEIVRQSVPWKFSAKGGSASGGKANDSIRRVFQAIRIEVNGELDNLKAFLPKALDLLEPKGRLVIISFHSLEDRIVKEFFNKQAKDCICPPEFPTCICDKVSTVRILTRKPVVASEQEAQENPRSKSAKLRAAEKI